MTSNILDFVLIIILVIVIYYLFFKNRNYEQNISNYDDEDEDQENQIELDNNDQDDQDNQNISNPTIKKKKRRVNPHFHAVQFHNDYRDTMNAFEILLPDKKVIFNSSNMPIVEITKPPSSEVKTLILRFIKEVNRTVKKKVQNNFSGKDWKDYMPDKKEKSGWDKEMDALGLPNSIYKEPAGKSPIKLIKLDHTLKQQTNDEIRYVVVLIVQKKNVIDQMVVQISFVVNTSDLNLDREFFDDKKENYQTPVMIEEISIIGFMTIDDFGEPTKRDSFYEYDKICDGKMFSDKEIIKQLNDKRREIEREQC